MKYSRILIISLASLSAFSCARELTENSNSASRLTLKAWYADDNSKTTLIDGGTEVYWEKDDRISAFIGGTNYCFTSLNKKESRSAVFASDEAVSYTPTEGNDYLLWALYPYDANAEFDGTSLTTTLPYMQTAKAGSFGSGCNISVGRANKMEVGFRNVTGGLRFSLQTEGVKSVSFEAAGGEYIAGEFTTEFSSDLPVVSEIVDGRSAIALTAPGNGTFETGKWYYITTLPAVLENGFNMVFETADSYAELNSTNKVAISRGKFGSIANIDSGLEWKQGSKIVQIVPSISEVEMYIGETVNVSVNLIPQPAVTPTISWTSDDPSIAAAGEGTISAYSEGETIVRISCQGVSAEIPVTVTKREIPRDEVIRTITIPQGKCTFANYADYGIYLPPDWERLNGVFIMQHGCGMEILGITRNQDLQYQAFARKWGLMLVETALHGDCGVWHNPESGSAAAIISIIEQIADEEYHPELKIAPWIIFGHSSGGYWTLGMLRDYPERILAAVTYSAAWDPQWDYDDEVARIPLLLRHAGANDAPTCLCEDTAKHTFAKTRGMDAPSSIAYNEGENHNYSHMRHMSIPFFEAALKQRLPKDGVHMGDIDRSKSWLGDPDKKTIFAEAGYTGDKSGLCVLPDQYCAEKWQEYVTTNDVADVTPPSAPYDLAVERISDTQVKLTWKAIADVESGIDHFEVCLNGTKTARVPSDGSVYQKFDTNGDNASPVTPVAMEAILKVNLGTSATISVKNVNQAQLASPEAQIEL